MLRKVRRLGAVVVALAMIFVLSVGACAAFVSKVDTDGTADGAVTLDGFTATFSVSKDGAKSINYYLSGDALDPEFWNNPNAYVEIDLTLNSAADDVYAILPAFTSTWGWVNPSVWDTYLVNGKTITLREPLSTYYSEFKNGTPLLIRAQICSNSEAAETVEVTVGELRFVGVDGAEAVQPDEEVSVPADDNEQDVSEPDDTSAEESTSDEPADEPADEPVSSAPEQDDTSRPITTTTQPSQTTTNAPVSTTTAASADSAGGSGIAGPIIIIVVVVVVIAAAAVGFIIYRKKKFY